MLRRASSLWEGNQGYAISKFKRINVRGSSCVTNNVGIAFFDAKGRGGSCEIDGSVRDGRNWKKDLVTLCGHPCK